MLPLQYRQQPANVYWEKNKKGKAEQKAGNYNGT